MSTEAPRKPGRGPEWERKSYEIRVRDGGYRDAQGVFHGVCRNWLEARDQDMLDSLPAGCRRSNGEDEVWACHSNSWSKYPALRLVGENSMALCRHCDPDRNPAMRPDWWGSSRHPVIAASSRAAKPTKAHWLGAYVLSLPLWYGVIVADVDLRYYWHFARHFTVGDPQSFMLQLALSVATWFTCLAGAHQALRRRWLSRSLQAGTHLAARPAAAAWRKAKGARRLPRRTA